MKTAPEGLRPDVAAEISPGARFEEMAVNLFGLARDGKTNAKGMPSLLQMAALGREFDDVVRFSKPPRLFQQLMFALLGPIAKARGYIGNDPKYLNMTAQRVEPIGPWPLIAEPESSPPRRRRRTASRRPR